MKRRQNIKSLWWGLYTLSDRMHHLRNFTFYFVMLSEPPKRKLIKEWMTSNSVKPILSCNHPRTWKSNNVAPDFKNKTRYTPYVSSGSQNSHIAINKGNINRQCSIYNVLSIKNRTLDSKYRKDNSDLRVKTPIPQGQLTGWSQA